MEKIEITLEEIKESGHYEDIVKEEKLQINESAGDNTVVKVAFETAVKYNLVSKCNE